MERRKHLGRPTVVVKIQDIDLSLQGYVRIKLQDTWHNVPWMYISAKDREFLSFLKQKHKGINRLFKCKEEFFIYENKLNISLSWKPIKEETAK